MKRLSVPVAVLGLLLLAGGQAMAGPVLDFTGGVAATSLTDQTSGWEFTLTTPITVTALGLWDEGANGLNNSHQLGLWTGGGTLLTSATITTANSAAVPSTSPAGDWRFTPIGALTLAPGDYVLGAALGLDDPDQVRVATDPPSTIAGVTFFVARNSFPGAGLIFPSTTVHVFSPGFFGPNLFVGSLPVATPEPSALLLLGSGLAGLAGLGGKQRRRK